MSRYGFYCRTDVRNGAGDRLAPLKIRRWKCREHGVVSFLPVFLARWTRYLAEAAGAVLKAMAMDGKPRFPDEVSGPEPLTARRWFCSLLDPALKRWLRQRCREDPPQNDGAPETIELAESYARQLSLNPLYFFRILQSARFHLASVA
jgi:hypothetical protein